MTDCFLATVISYNPLTKIAKIMPLVILKDGTEISNTPLDAKTIQGIKPAINDIALIVTSRNNLDDKSISEYFEPSWANCRLVGIVSTNGSYTLRGNYVFESDVTIQGDLSVGGDADIQGDLDVNGDTDIQGELTVQGEATFQSEATFNALAKFPQDAKFGVTEISFLLHTHSTSAPGVPTGVPM